jgi:hypothetical protein
MHSQLCQVSGFYGLVVGGFLRHCVLFTWALVDSTTKGHKVGVLFLTRPYLHLSTVVI